MSILSDFSDLVFPRECEICGRPCDRPKRQICSACLNRLPLVPIAGCCRLCGRAVEGYEGEYLCDDCADAKKRPSFDRAASVMRFEQEARKLVLRYKFRGGFYLRRDFVDWLEGTVRGRFEHEAIDAIIPMPIVLLHRWDRGYNQCVELAQGLAKRLDRRYLGSAIARVGEFKDQRQLNESDRRENVKNTFKVRCPKLVRGRTVMVVDDVMTTGATLSACAAALKEAGAWRVWCVTMARSIRI